MGLSLEELMTPIVIVAGLVLAQAVPARTLTYHDAIREALVRSNDLKSTRARLDQARTIGWKAWAAQLPQVSAGASWTRNDKAVEVALPPPLPERLTFQPLNAVGAQVQATVPLFAPQVWFGIGAAEAGQRQAELTLETARREILFAVAQLYFNAVGAKYAMQITEKQLATARDHEQDAKIRHLAGTTPKVAMLRAEIDRARAEQDLKTARIGYDSARVSLATMLDWRDTGFDVEAPPDERVVPEDGAELELSALRDRPDVQAATAAVMAAEHARGAVMSSYLPSVGAVGRAQWQTPPGLTGERRSWAVGLAVTWNLFDGTLRQAQAQEGVAKVAEAEANRRSTELRAREEVARARLDLEAAIANREKAQEQVELARENQRLVEMGYKVGTATYIEVSDANNQLVTAELAAVNEQVRSRLAVLRLLKTAGRFEPD